MTDIHSTMSLSRTHTNIKKKIKKKMKQYSNSTRNLKKNRSTKKLKLVWFIYLGKYVIFHKYLFIPETCFQRLVEKQLKAHFLSVCKSLSASVRILLMLRLNKFKFSYKLQPHENQICSKAEQQRAFEFQLYFMDKTVEFFYVFVYNSLQFYLNVFNITPHRY